MPGRDGSGPMGRGALTGRGLGYCTGDDAVRYGAGRRLGLGLGYGRGFRRRSFNVEPIDPRPYKEVLEEEKNLLKHRLNMLEKQLDNLSEEDK